MRITIFILLCTVLACNQKKGSKQVESLDLKRIDSLCIHWNSAIAARDTHALSAFYADQISIYGATMSKKEMLESKFHFFAQFSDFSQGISGEVSIDQINDYKVKVVFPKRATYGGKTFDVIGYLIFEKMDEQWKITIESDETTDKKNSDNRAKATEPASNAPKVGTSVVGDFDGDGNPEFVFISLVKEGSGNPAEDGHADAYSLASSNTKLKPKEMGCCEGKLINEGDLDLDGTDELSVFQAPMNGCTYSYQTLTYKRGAWQTFIKPFLIPTGCDQVSDDVLAGKVFRENNKIYYLEPDFTSDDFRSVRKELKTLK